MKEIERQFLCAAMGGPALREAEARLEITQSYLATGDPAVRIRRQNESWTLGVKAGKGLVREEFEFEVPAEVGENLERIAGARRVTKVRYRLGRWELDVFTGDLEGLLIAEVELEREEEPLPAVPDGVTIVREITGEERFTNQKLSTLSAQSRAALLEAVEAEILRFERRMAPSTTGPSPGRPEPGPG